MRSRPASSRWRRRRARPPTCASRRDVLLDPPARVGTPAEEKGAPTPAPAPAPTLSEEERAALRPHARELAARKVYQVSALWAVLERIEVAPASAAARWKSDVESAIETGNARWFEELTRI